MPLLAQLIGSLLGGLVTWLAQVFTKQVAVRVTAGAALVVIVAALMAVFNLHVAPLVAQAFATSYGQVIGLAFPPVAGTCLATITTVWLACASYKLQQRVIGMSAGV